MRALVFAIVAASFVAACDAGPDPEAARGYATQIDAKAARQCGRGYQAFVGRFAAQNSETRGIDAPLKSLDLFPPMFFAPFDQQEFESFAGGYGDEVRDRLLGLRSNLVRTGTALKNDYVQPNWQAYCDGMKQMARTLRNMG
jgi:hypothetical protein